MTIDLTRRTLLQLAGASSLCNGGCGAARAEGTPQGGGPTYASRTPMRVGMVTLRVKNLDKVADYYRDVIGLTVMERSQPPPGSARPASRCWCWRPVLMPR